MLFGVCGDTVNAGQSGIYMKVNSYSNDVSEETSKGTVSKEDTLEEDASQEEDEEKPEGSLPAPDHINVNREGGQILISWDEVEDAEHYSIKKLSDGKETTIHTIYKNRYTDYVEEEENPQYTIYAVDEENQKGAASKKVKTCQVAIPRLVTAQQNQKDNISVSLQKDSLKTEESQIVCVDVSNGKVWSKVIEKEKTDGKILFSGLTTGHTYEIKIRGFVRMDHNICFGEWSDSIHLTIEDKQTIETVNADMAIEADVSVSGSGSGYHAKLVIGTPLSAVSFGIQHDKGAIEEYRNKTVALLENIHSNNKGGQEYPRFGLLNTGESYKLLLTLNEDGTGSGYINGFKVGDFENLDMLTTGDAHFWVEGAARLNGDSVNAAFQNIKYKVTRNGPIYSDVFNGSNNIDASVRNNGIYCSTTTEKAFHGTGMLPTIRISGQLGGIVSDWDYDYESASSVWMFQRVHTFD